jgi:hypothetical protein
MSSPGSHDHAAAIAARKGLDAGLTRLGIALLTHVASRGTNFQTDNQVRGELTKPDGTRYHRESIGRKRREITRAGLLSGKRYYPGQRPPGATYRTSHGCVATVVVWSALKVSAPVLRGARRLERVRARQAEPRAPERPRDIIPAGELAELARSFLHPHPK